MPKKIIEKTEEEQLAEKRERDIKDLKDYVLPHLSEPAYKFNIGDKVILGSFKESVISEILYDGKAFYQHLA